MRHIGIIIEEYRNMLGLSRKDLTDNVCSEKYLYMIEKGKRTPSAEITRHLGNKMGVDLFEFYEYIDCEEPVKVKSLIYQFNKYRRENELDLLADITESALLLNDFKKSPWIYEIELNRFTIKVLKEMEFEKVIFPIQELIEEMKLKQSNNICLINFYVLLSTCYQMSKEIEKSREVIELASQALLGKEKIEKYSQIVITLGINKITLYYLANDLNKVIEEGMKLNSYENEICCHIRSHHIFFYLAFAYYQKGFEDEGIDWFMKALYTILIRKKTMDMYYLSKYDIFDVILHDKRIPINLANLIKKSYNISETVPGSETTPSSKYCPLVPVPDNMI